MRFHHMAVFVSDLQEAIHLWRDVMGFDLVVETEIPDGPVPGPKTYMYPKLLDDIFKVKGARSKMALLASKEGALIELQQCEVPKIQKTSPENLRYGHTGFH
jgi:catechol 2,3-dioxygenase-like lactoylglutathione lyase family enzyme